MAENIVWGLVALGVAIIVWRELKAAADQTWTE